MVQKVELSLSKAIEGFKLQKRAQQLSEHTLTDYDNALTKLTRFLGNPEFRAITIEDIQRFLTYLSTEPQTPGGVVKRKAKPLSKKSVLNVHTALSALWTWAVDEGIADTHLIRAIKRPKPEGRAINPLTRDDTAALLDACEHQRSYVRRSTVVTNTRCTAIRDVAIVHLMLDTGIRVSELCDATLSDLDMKNHRLKVFGKGSKERMLPIGRRTTAAIWKYLATRPEAQSHDPLFCQNQDDTLPLTRRGLLTLLTNIGNRAGIEGVHPHRLRHTFAINFLRNGGSIYALQAILGHSSLDMVKRYLAIVQSDIENAHKQASPMDNWKL